jgi:YidC/Oxa1 family membrane protein insertase
MRKMQEIQPEPKAIQERYSKLKATDPAKQKMNQELMALYRDSGVNPASGCSPDSADPAGLPRLLLAADDGHRAARRAVRRVDSRPLAAGSLLRHAVLVGASQIVTQWMTPQAGVDPAQQKMMMIMPLVLIFVFVSPGRRADLLAGWQRLAHRPDAAHQLHSIRRKFTSIRPAAERRVKRVGGGKTDAAREN